MEISKIFTTAIVARCTGIVYGCNRGAVPLIAPMRVKGEPLVPVFQGDHLIVCFCGNGSYSGMHSSGLSLCVFSVLCVLQHGLALSDVVRILSATTLLPPFVE
eukprot:m.618831 g.618831  ORF g.618831 m.618831 type:complete len:103 (+) comp22529_c2_seq16:1413-1721(+)